ncbi:hypothetical protein M0804_009755 [Polistes exclamans]|nr:hypothetical protein M0804_009755 [Polistes exclamans]
MTKVEEEEEDTLRVGKERRQYDFRVRRNTRRKGRLLRRIGMGVGKLTTQGEVLRACRINRSDILAYGYHPFGGFYGASPPFDLAYIHRSIRLIMSSQCCAALGKWCPRREWSSPPDAQRAASDAARRGVLYSSVFLGSPGVSEAYQKLS